MVWHHGRHAPTHAHGPHVAECRAQSVHSLPRGSAIKSQCAQHSSWAGGRLMLGLDHAWKGGVIRAMHRAMQVVHGVLTKRPPAHALCARLHGPLSRECRAATPQLPACCHTCHAWPARVMCACRRLAAGEEGTMRRTWTRTSSTSSWAMMQACLQQVRAHVRLGGWDGALTMHVSRARGRIGDCHLQHKWMVSKSPAWRG